MGGQRKRFDLEKQEAVSYRTLEARARQFLRMSIITLTTGTSTSILDGLYKNQATMDTYIQ